MSDDSAATESPFDIVHREDFARDGNWLLARRSLGLRSFGLNMVEIPAGGSIPEHDERESDQEEVYVVLAGDAQMVIDGVVHAAPAGTFCRLSPEPRRRIDNEGHETAVVLIASAPRTSGFKPLGWA